MNNKDIANGLEEIRDRVERTGYDDQTAEEKIEELNQVLRSGDDPIYVLDQAIEKLVEES